MRSSITISLNVALDPNTFVYVTRFGEVEYLCLVEARASTGPPGLGSWPIFFWTIPWVERFYKTLEVERSIKVLW